MQNDELDALTISDELAASAGSAPGDASETSVTPSQDATSADDTERAAGAAELSARPDDVPEKFWDSEAGTIRTEALLRTSSRA